jgi:hypothetical protein
LKPSPVTYNSVSPDASGSIHERWLDRPAGASDVADELGDAQLASADAVKQILNAQRAKRQRSMTNSFDAPSDAPSTRAPLARYSG